MLVGDGLPPANMFELERMTGCVEQAYEPFGDLDRLRTRFAVADSLHTDGPTHCARTRLDGRR